MKQAAEEKGKTFTEDDFREAQVKRKEKLFGNIGFIGGLYTQYLLRDDAAK